jgi:hypothetical protein
MLPLISLEEKTNYPSLVGYFLKHMTGVGCPTIDPLAAAFSLLALFSHNLEVKPT